MSSPKPSIYLDYNASAPLLPDVRLALKTFLDQNIANPSSVHAWGRATRNIIDQARETVAQSFGIKSDHVVFTSGATESNNWVIKGFEGTVITSDIEHDSIFDARPDALRIRALPSGIIDLLDLERLLEISPRPTLVSVMGANNETGVIQPLDEVIRLSRAKGALVHSDAVQVWKRIPFDVHSLDYVSLSGHKIGALSGTGVLMAPRGWGLRSLIVGGGQERFYRAGTENIMGVMALETALRTPISWDGISKQRDFFENRLTTLFPDIKIVGKTSPRLPNTSMIIVPHIPSSLQLMQCDLEGIMISSGSACSSGKIRPSRVLKSMGFSDEDRSGALRISLSPESTPDDIDSLLNLLTKLYQDKGLRYAS